MKIFFAVSWMTDKSVGDGLTKKGGRNRLLSYHFINEQNTIYGLKEYCSTGKFNPNKK